MCGIVGIVSFDGSSAIDEARLRRMRDIIAYRGPDDAGLWMGDGVGLGHRRLSIVDVASGHQPMLTEDQKLCLVFNGEIYNHADLRPDLEVRGHRYRTRSDTETILHLYNEYGDGALERMRGMFAFALWDRSRRRLLLGRDRLGIKPLYYAATDRELIFASEIKAIVAAGVRPEFNAEVVPEFLASRFVSGEETFYRGIRKLLPGHSLTWSPSAKLTSRRYWQMPPAASAAPRSFEVEAADLRARLRGAVKRHLMSDVPVGLFLSGGIDSTALAALTAQMIDEPLRTFSVGFENQATDELPYARMAAKHVGAIHREVVVSPDQFFGALPRLVWQEDEPISFPASVPLYFVSKLAAEDVKVVLTGEGADELFLGYNRYRVALWNSRLGQPYWAAVPRVARQAIQRAIARLPEGARRKLSRTFLALEPGARSLFLENFAVFPTAMHPDLLHRDRASTGRRDPWATLLQCYADADGDMLDRMSRADLATYLHELLMKQDQMSMAASIESRVPFLDDSLIEHVSAMHGRMKIRGWQTKAVLRAAVQDLIPREILARPKMGFPVPLGSWLQTGFWPVVEEFLLGPRAQERKLFHAPAVRRLAEQHRRAGGNTDQLWLLVNLEIWQRIVVDGEDPDHVMRPVQHRLERGTETFAPARPQAVAAEGSARGVVAMRSEPLVGA